VRSMGLASWLVPGPGCSFWCRQPPFQVLSREDHAQSCL